MADAPERIQDQSVIEEMQDSYLTYAMSVIMARALPDDLLRSCPRLKKVACPPRQPGLFDSVP